MPSADGQPPDVEDPLAGVPAELVERYHLNELPFDQQHRTLGDLTELDGARVLVTGGGGRGLGGACVDRFAAQGASVAVLDVNANAAAAAARDAADRWGGQVFAIEASITDHDEARHGVNEAVDRLGGLDVLVNNAGGIFGRQWGAFGERTPDQIEAVIELNLLGTMYVTKAALDHLLAKGTGRIINVASEGGRTAMSGLATYNASKAGVIGFTRNLAHELGPRGVTVAGVAPGAMVSEGLLSLLRSSRSAGADAVAEGVARSTIGRPSLPEEVANMVVFLATEAGAYVHGTTVSVGGGMGD